MRRRSPLTNSNSSSPPRALHIQTVTRVADPPVVASVSPRSGPAAGGALVTITGANLSGASAVHVGAATASEVQVTSPETITARTPPGTAGTADVTVTTASASSFMFAEAAATSVECATSQTCTVVTPAHVAGIADVRATVAAKTSPKATADQYLYE